MSQSIARSVKRLHPALRDDIGDLITRRPLPGPGIRELNPFLFLNHHGPQHYSANNRGLPFGPHPHRGFETVTFILEGSLAHADSGDHQSVIHAGGVQWMTAGKGLVHAELSPEEFKRDGGPMEILQLWINLPARLKMTEPAYTGLQKESIPEIALDENKNAHMHLIAGEYNNQRGAIQSLTKVFMSVLAFTSGARFTLPAPKDRIVFLYIVRGEPMIGDVQGKPMHLVELNKDGDAITVSLPTSATSDAVILFGHADPINEPVVSHGPFVMNTHEEIQQAIIDYQNGRFGGLAS